MLNGEWVRFKVLSRRAPPPVLSVHLQTAITWEADAQVLPKLN